MPYEHVNGTPVQETIIGLGATALVVSYNGNALKLPQAHREPGAAADARETEDYCVECNSAHLENEKKIYHRLSSHDGIIRVINMSDKGIEMANAKNGSLVNYLLNPRNRASF